MGGGGVELCFGVNCKAVIRIERALNTTRLLSSSFLFGFTFTGCMTCIMHDIYFNSDEYVHSWEITLLSRRSVDI